MVARVTAVNRDNYLVRNEQSEVLAEPTGGLAFSAESNVDLPIVGDWAFVQYHNSDTFAIIHDLFPRKSVLRRKAAGRKIDYQMIASNIDVALIVQSCDFDFNLRRLERYIVMVNEGRIDPVLLLTKSDLVSPGELEERISDVRQANVSCRVIALSSKTGSGLDELRQLLEKGKTYCLLGSSGVGKTTLLNHLVGRPLMATNEVRARDGKGRHTTARRQLILLDQGAMLIDTPGMRELGNIGAGDAVDESFSRLYSYRRSGLRSPERAQERRVERRTLPQLSQADKGIGIPSPVLCRETEEGQGVRAVHQDSEEAYEEEVSEVCARQA